MKRCLYLMSVLTMIWSLAACGKAISSHQALFETEEEHRGFVDENETIEIVHSEDVYKRQRLSSTDRSAVRLKQQQQMQKE